MPSRLRASGPLGAQRSVLCRAAPAAFADARRGRQRYCFACTIGKETVLSAESVHEPPQEYAVVWRSGDGPTSSGKLELGADDLVLHASSEDELRIPFDELSSAEIGRAADERVNGDKSLVLERHSCERVLVAALGGVGLLGELTDLLARLRAERAARACVAVVVPIRRGRPSTSSAWGSSDTTSSSASARSSSSSKATAQPRPSMRSRGARVC